MSEPLAIDVKPLTENRFADLAALFEEGGDYPSGAGARIFNSAVATGRIRRLREIAPNSRRSPSGSWLPGSSAYRDGRAVGWVSMGRARTTSGLPPRGSWARWTTSRSGRSSASSCPPIPRQGRRRAPATASIGPVHGATRWRHTQPRSRTASASHRQTRTTARCRCSKGPASRSSSAANGTPPARSDRSSGSTYSGGSLAPGLRHSSFDMDIVVRPG